MTVLKLHSNEIDIDAKLVHELLKTQFPHWADLPLEVVGAGGTDNVLFKLGEEMVLRLPRLAQAQATIEKEYLWLPKLAPFLPIAIPKPLGLGTPTSAYPFVWSIYRWLEGKNAFEDQSADQDQIALEMAGFIQALRQVKLNDAPLTEHYQLRTLDEQNRDCIKALHDEYNPDELEGIWQTMLELPDWHGTPVWIHSDLHIGNFLVHQGKLRAVIDFGYVGLGDPARDLLIAWSYFTPKTRASFRTALNVDEITWARGRGWAFSKALIALPYYKNTNPLLTSMSRYIIGQVLEEFKNT